MSADPTPPPTVVVVTLPMIYDVVQKTEVRVTSIESKIDALASDSKDHEDRIRSLEQARWKIVGGAGAVGFIAGLIPTLVAIFSR